MCTVLGESGPSSPICTAPTFSTAMPEQIRQGRTPNLGAQGPEGTCSTVAWNKAAQGMVEQKHSHFSWQHQAARDKSAHPHRL